MAAWWNYNEEAGRLPQLLSHQSIMTQETEVNDRRKEIEYLTGCNFLLLGSILAIKTRELDMENPATSWLQFKASSVESVVFSWVKRQITEFHCAIITGLQSDAGGMNM